ncbi:MAG: DUF2461 domain-containing protein [Bacteroidetes bacterium]|nr:DUF2461 domain-containing protein [Bacteroidota bacterium]
MKNKRISPSGIEFLKALKKNNDRDWFNANKEWYLKELKNIEEFADALLNEMNKHDAIETPGGKKSLHRIYRDVRFSKNKTPYNIHWGGSFSRASKARRGTYYFHIEPGNTFVAGGFWGPNPEDLKRIRNEFSCDPEPFRKILKNKNFVKLFGKLQGEQIKTTPKGFSPDDAAIDLLRFKQFQLIRKFSDKEMLSQKFLMEVNSTFKHMRLFLDYMSEVLTTDVNGISLI